MNDDLEWAKIRTQNTSGIKKASFSALRITMLFSGFAIALGLFVAPMLDRSNENYSLGSFKAKGIDPFTTASTSQSSSSTYVIRRSIFQTNPTATCIIRQNGVRTGDC